MVDQPVYREITNATNARTLIAAVIPFVATGRKIPQLYLKADAGGTACVLGALNSYALDFIVRCKLSGTSIGNFLLVQLPIPAPTAFEHQIGGETKKAWISQRVLELTYTALDLEAFAADCGWRGPPFKWDDERRFLLRCELDAAYFQLYLGSDADWQQQPEALTRAFPTPRAAVAYILDTFPSVKRKDETKHGRYRTKETILQIYDALQNSIRTGQPYQTLLDPPPADPRCCQTPRVAVPTPEWMDRPLVLPSARRGTILPDRYRATVVPHLVYQSGGRVSLDRFRRAYWLLTEPATLQRYANDSVGAVAKAWGKVFRDQPIRTCLFRT